MSAYKIPDEITAKVSDINKYEKKKKQHNDFYNNLDKINNKYNFSNDNFEMPNEIKLDRINFDKPNEEEIYKMSENSLYDYKNEELNKIDNEYINKENDLTKAKYDLIDNTAKQKDKLSSYYDNAKNNAESQALKRGLGRSSIIINQLDAFDNAEIADYKNLDEKLNNQVNAINFELNALNTQKKVALSNFDIAYAVKLEDKINSLTNQLNNKELEINKYNNDIALKEAEYNKKLKEMEDEFIKSKDKHNIDLIKMYGEYGTLFVDKLKENEKFNYAKNYLNSLNENDRNLLLNDENFIKKIGKSYDKLKEEFS